MIGFTQSPFYIQNIYYFTQPLLEKGPAGGADSTVMPIPDSGHIKSNYKIYIIALHYYCLELSYARLFPGYISWTHALYISTIYFNYNWK